MGGGGIFWRASEGGRAARYPRDDIEPGGFRTDWAGSSTTVHEIRDDYGPTVGRMMQYRESSTPLGDPAKAGDPEDSKVPEPSVRLLLGSDAYTVARAVDEAKIASDEHWKELTVSTDSDDGEVDISHLRHVTATTRAGS